MVVRKHPFDQQQASYYAYLRRWKATGEGLENACCVAHRGVESTPFVHFVDFLRHSQRLMENELFMDGLRKQGTQRGGAMPRLIKQQRDLRALLLIEEEEKTPAETFAERIDRLKQGPTGAKSDEKDDDGMVTV